MTTSFEYDADAGRLDYATEVSGVDAGAVYGVVLRHTDDENRWSVAVHLSGPGVLSTEGRIRLDEALRDDLEAGRLHLELVTPGSPVSTVRTAVVLPAR